MSHITHDALGLSRAQKRRLQKLGDEVDRIIEGDHRFFKRHKDRSYRLRRASSADLKTNAELGDENAARSGLAWFVAIRQIALGARMRLYFLSAENNDTDEPEESCRYLYQSRQTSYQRAIERSLETAVSKRDQGRGP